MAAISGLWWWWDVWESRWSSLWMAWRLVCESMKSPAHGSSLYVLSSTLMAASSALMIVWASSWPDASM